MTRDDDLPICLPHQPDAHEQAQDDDQLIDQATGMRPWLHDEIRQLVRARRYDDLDDLILGRGRRPWL